MNWLLYLGIFAGILFLWWLGYTLHRHNLLFKGWDDEKFGKLFMVLTVLTAVGIGTWEILS